MKRLKIFIDVCMTILLVLLFPTARSNPTLHIILGFIFIPVVIIHLLLNGKWLFGSIKKFFSDKLNFKTQYMFLLVVGLMIAFFVCIYSGIVVYQSDAYQSFSNLNRHRRLPDTFIWFMYRLHGISAIVCVILTVLHVKVHWGYLKSFFKGKNE